MQRITPHTAPPSNSKTATYGYEAYASATNKSMYAKNSQTGYTYFGARYYDSGLSVWLSVDPLASKAPNWSPYNYVWGNPIKNIDEFGMWGKLAAKYKHWRAERTYGKNRVGKIHHNIKNNEYGFKVYNSSKDKKIDGNNTGRQVDGIEVLDKGRRLYNNKAYKSYKWSRSSGYVGFKARMARFTTSINDFMGKDPTGLGSIDTSVGSNTHKVCKAVASLILNANPVSGSFYAVRKVTTGKNEFDEKVSLLNRAISGPTSLIVLIPNAVPGGTLGGIIFNTVVDEATK